MSPLGSNTVQLAGSLLEQRRTDVTSAAARLSNYTAVIDKEAQSTLKKKKSPFVIVLKKWY